MACPTGSSRAMTRIKSAGPSVRCSLLQAQGCNLLAARSQTGRPPKSSSPLRAIRVTTRLGPPSADPATGLLGPSDTGLPLPLPSPPWRERQACRCWTWSPRDSARGGGQLPVQTGRCYPAAVRLHGQTTSDLATLGSLMRPPVLGEGLSPYKGHVSTTPSTRSGHYLPTVY